MMSGITALDPQVRSSGTMGKLSRKVVDSITTSFRPEYELTSSMDICLDIIMPASQKESFQSQRHSKQAVRRMGKLCVHLSLISGQITRAIHMHTGRMIKDGYQ